MKPGASRARRPCARRWTWVCAISVFLVCLLLPGCGLRTIKVTAQAGQCLNPPAGHCDEYGTNSILLAANVYQLRHEVDTTSLEWEKFLEDGKDMEALADYLTDADDVMAMKQRFTVTAEARATAKLKRRLRTRYLLVVTTGRAQGEQSILLTPVPWRRQGRALCLEYYDVWALKKAGDTCEFTFQAIPGTPAEKSEEEP